jgi:squalene-hopene/tetraprenyl-beta-curcumene cyclase
MKRYLISCTGVLCLLVLGAIANPTEQTLTSSQSADIQRSLQIEAEAAAVRAYDWLVAQQHEDGYWSNPGFPAITALAVWALADAGPDYAEAVDRGCAYILSCVQEDGGIYVNPTEKRKGGGLVNYNTALCMTALHQVGRPEWTPIILDARALLARTQLLGSGSIYEGGMGYDAATDREYTDLSNSYIAFEAMRLTEPLEDLRTDGDRVDLDWVAAAQFVQRIQNLPEYNDRPWVSDTPANRGGFAYHPENTRAGTYTDEAGVVRFNSMGSMTYAGMLSFIYAEVDRNDPRVRAAADWAIRHWTLDENRGAGKEGLYYYYNVLSKGLAAYGQDLFIRPEAGPLNWRQELLEALVQRQRIADTSGLGYWVNDVGRYWENDPVLVTAYSLIAMQTAGLD